ncbi:hypothetical protein ACIRU8_41190 [Streptomyces sp. NPDC101175]|uniref:hypothetical protein n=1 Tax=Streptomyces sp. NPDC101175 TaxID=3366123 RepID=UPI003839202C
MSTDTSPASYPKLFAWFSGDAPDTAQIAHELALMAKSSDLARLLTGLRLHGETDHFCEALQTAFPKLNLASPDFSSPQGALGVLAQARLKTVGMACLATLGEPEHIFNPKLFTSDATGLLYDNVPVFCVVGAKRERVFRSGRQMLYIVSPDHDLKGWLQWKNSDMDVRSICGVTPDDHASGYNAVDATGSLTWECSYGKFDTAVELLNTIAKSEAFGKVDWGQSYCTAGWVSSLMPSLTTSGDFRVPGKTLTIGQNVHTPPAIGSAWIKDVGGDCTQAYFPVDWTDGVRTVLLPRTATDTKFQNIQTFCAILSKKFSPQQNTSKQERTARFTYLIAQHPDAEQILGQMFANFGDYYTK